MINKSDESGELDIKMPDKISSELESIRAYEQRELEHAQDCKRLWMKAYCASLAGGLYTSADGNSYARTAERQANEAVKNFKANFR